MHYHGEVWVPEKISLDDAQSFLEDVLKPYSENNADADAEETFYDWFQVGGRYTGRHDNYIPWEDIDNYETCDLCYGTGIRADGMESYRGCNGCSGRGVKVKWHYKKHPQDMMALKDIPDDMSCYTLIVCRKSGDPEIHHMENWNGNNFVPGKFNGLAKPYLKQLGITNGYLITVDYHN